MKEKKKEKIGQKLRGQGWIELHGNFTVEQLKAIIIEIENNCKGLEKKNGVQG